MHGSLIQWNVNSWLCSVEWLYYLSLLSLLPSRSFVHNNEILSFLLQYFSSCLDLDAGWHVCRSLCCIPMEHGFVSGFWLCFEGLPTHSTSPPLYQPSSWCNSANFRQVTWAVKQVHFGFYTFCHMPAWRWEGRKVVNVLRFIKVDFRLSVKYPQVIRIRKEKIENKLLFGRQDQV